MKYNQPKGITDPDASYIDGDPSVGRRGSIPPAACFEEHQRELVQVLVSAGTSPSSNDLTQLVAAHRSQKYCSAVASNVAPASANTIILAFDPPLQEPLKLGHVVRFRAVQAITGAATLITDTLTHPLVRADGTALAANDIENNQVVECLWDGVSKWQMTNFRGAYTVSGTPDTVVPHDRADGQCYLSVIGGNLVLKPRNGNRLIVNDIVQQIVSTGVSLAPAGLTPSTLYYIYAAIVTGSLVLEASATTHTTETTNGTEVKTGDVTRRLVGITYVIGGPAFSDNLTASWFNRKSKSVQGHFTGNPSTSSTTLVELDTSIRTQIVTFADDDVQLSCNGEAFNQSNNLCGVVSAISVDAAAQDSLTAFSFSPTAGAGQPLSIHGRKRLSEGMHTISLYGDAQMQSGQPTLGAWQGGTGPANDRAVTYLIASFMG